MLLLLAQVALGTCVEAGSNHRDPRPGLSGPEQTISNGRFMVHYTLEGEDTPTGPDQDGNGVPDMAERVLDAMAWGEQLYLDLGYRPLIKDDGDGGSDAIDIYLLQIDANGYARASDAVDGDIDSCYMRIDPDLGSIGGQILESVSIHELHHCVQFRYTTNAHGWIYEATATMEQYRNLLDDALLAAVGVLYGERLSQPELPLDHEGGRYEYAGMIVMKFWEEYDGTDTSRLPALWEALALEQRWDQAMDTEARRLWGRTLPSAFLEYATWNGFACARDDGAHYGDAVVPCPFPSTVPIEERSWDDPTVRVSLPNTRFTASYAEVFAAGDDRPVALSCGAVASGAKLGVQVVALDSGGVGGEQAAMFVEDVAGSVRLEASVDPEGSFLFVFASTGGVGLVADCQFARVDAVVEERQGCGCSGAGLAPVWGLLAPLLLMLRRPRRRFSS